MTKDVVCGMQIDEKSAKSKSQYQGTTYPFCSAECKTLFEQDPATYAHEKIDVKTNR